ncbi:hypothetical protein TrLO_g15003 [Triparma laevis f. longispina]|uniref:Sulfotransferase n=1 Tax=Triparma laevis f. longispina TaxID=1714387 RepID=A0A9W7C7D9_9STRA|nr:hypothetical protein TrLO_g15003 [Triparma laevis f. longispina]
MSLIIILDPINKVLGGHGLPLLTTPIVCGTAALCVVSLPFTSSLVHPKSSVRLRNIWFVVNRICSAFGLLQTVPNKAKLLAIHEQVIDEEREAFNDNIGCEESKREIFTIQLNGVDEKGNMFTPLGRYIFSVDMMLRLKRRLRFAKYVNSLPPSTLNQPSSVEVNAPIVIVGLPRTGSTMISRLLSADPNSRSPLYWEFAHDSDDVSPADPAKANLDYRAKPVDDGFAKLSLFSPNGLAEFFKFHKVGATEHEEITGFSRRYFYDMETALLSPEAQRKRLEWQASSNVDRSFLATHLAVWFRLQPRARGGEYWVIKSPAYTAWLPELAAAFPNARFVFTSRDPKSVLPSLCGLNEVASSIKFNYRNGRDLAPLGEGVVGRISGYAKQQEMFIKDQPEKCLALSYREMVKEPLTCVNEIYKHAGKEFTKEIEACMKAHMDNNKKGKHGKAVYSLDKFQLSEKMIEEEFAGYQQFL